MPQMTPPPANAQADQGAGAATQAIQAIQQGFQQLGKMMQQAQDQLDPDDMKLFQMAVQATDNLIQALTGGGEQEEEQEQKPQQSGPMAANANSNAKPSPNQGY